METQEEKLKLIHSRLVAHESIEMESEDSLLIVWYREFFGVNKEYLFQLNGKAIYGCKTKQIALKKIEHYLRLGFEFIE